MSTPYAGFGVTRIVPFAFTAAVPPQVRMPRNGHTANAKEGLEWPGAYLKLTVACIACVVSL